MRFPEHTLCFATEPLAQPPRRVPVHRGVGRAGSAHTAAIETARAALAVKTGRSPAARRSPLPGGGRTPQLVDYPVQVQTLAAPVWREGVGIDGDAVSFEPRSHRRQRPTGPVRRRRRFRQRTAVRPNELHASGRIQRDAEPLLVDCPMVPAAEEDQIVERRRPAVGPVPDVVSIDADVPASRKPALAVAGVQRPVQGRRDRPRAAADGEYLAVGAVLHPDRRRVAGEPPRRLHRDVDAPRLVQHRLAAAGGGGRGRTRSRTRGRARTRRLAAIPRVRLTHERLRLSSNCHRACFLAGVAPRRHERCRRRRSRGKAGRVAVSLRWHERCRRRRSRGNVGRFGNVGCFGQGVRVHVYHHLIPVARRPPVEPA